MSIHEKQRRARIFNPVQHPLKHSFDDISYTPGGNAFSGQITTITGALDWLFAVLYPQSAPNVPDVASLPITDALNTMRVVDDDGDGKAASYRWEKREGEVSASWHKIYDMDWGVDSILQQMYLKTQDLYVSKKGYDELDGAGNPVVGVLAGAYIYGGATANTNLTLFANSGDGTGASTGYVQLGDNARPTADNSFDFGTTALRFKKFWSYAYQAGTLLISAGSIVDSGGTINFGSNDLTTTGTISAGGITLTSATFGTLTVAGGSITDTSGNISFADENLVTIGTLGSGILTVTDSAQTIVLDPDLAGLASIATSRATLTFGATNLLTTGSITGGQVNADNLRLDGNTFSSTNANGNIIVVANGTGLVDVQSAMTTIGQTVSGVLAVTGQLNADNLRLDGNVLSSTNLNGNITLTPNGSGFVEPSSSVIPASNSALDLGSSTKVWNDLFIDGSITDGTTSIALTTLLSLFDINTAVGVNYTIFWNGTKWISSAPDTEIVHGNLSGLGADDHVQYALLAGRTGGQTLIGGTLANNNLVLESTSHATKGFVKFKSDLAPFADAVYAAGWSGTDIGDPSLRVNNIYTAGEMIGMRVENLASNFVTSPQNTGRLAINTTTGLLIYDTGAAVVAVGAQHSEQDTAWDGSQLTQDFVVSGVLDARKANWQIKNNTDDFNIIYCPIYGIDAVTVRVTTAVPLPAGSYRLIGLA